MRKTPLSAFLLATVLAAATLDIARAASPEKVVSDFFDALEARDPANVQTLLADDVTNVLPYTASGDTQPAALRRFEGRSAVMTYFEGAMERIRTIAFEDTAIAPTADGNTVFVETRGDMVLADGRAYRNLYVWVFETEDGQITAIREYFNPVTAALAFGRPLGPQTD
jgi:ketosteroid isomerase-like protein